MARRISVDVKKKTTLIEDYELSDEELEQQIVMKAQQEIEEQAEANRTTLREQAKTALANNKVFFSLDSTTNADAVEQIKALTKQMNGVIRLVISQLEETE